MRHGYVDQNENTWVKGDWTVRFDKNSVEIFNDPDKAPGKYYTGPINKITIEDYLEEIDNNIKQFEEIKIEPGVLNQLKAVPVYYYEKLTVEKIEEVMLKLEKEHKLKEEHK